MLSFSSCHSIQPLKPNWKGRLRVWLSEEVGTCTAVVPVVSHCSTLGLGKLYSFFKTRRLPLKMVLGQVSLAVYFKSGIQLPLWLLVSKEWRWNQLVAGLHKIRTWLYSLQYMLRSICQEKSFKYETKVLKDRCFWGVSIYSYCSSYHLQHVGIS